jgi:hypothetical protein
MGGVKKFLFGSSPETKSYDPIRPELEYERAARERINANTQGMFEQGGGIIGNAAGRLNQMALEYLPETALKKQQGLIQDWTKQQTGEVLNSLVHKGILNSSVADNALSDIGSKANRLLLSSYNDAVDRASRLNAQAYGMGQGMLGPYMDLYNRWLAFRAGTPLSLTQEQGSNGLLGGALQGTVGMLGNQWGKKLADKWGLG